MSPPAFGSADRSHDPSHRYAMEDPVHNAPIHAKVLEVYALEGSVPVRGDVKSLTTLGCRPVERDLLGVDPLARHDPGKLARAVLALAPEVTA